METKKKIDFSKFKCEIYSPDGILLKDARINNNHEFYASELVPEQTYFLVFSYKDILIECIEFVCDYNDRVFYISPAQMIHEHTVTIPPSTFVNSIRGKIKKRSEFNVPQMLWAKHALDAFIDSTHEGAKKTICQSDFVAFKAGAALAKAVK
jgi:hypothetical protein